MMAAPTDGADAIVAAGLRSSMGAAVIASPAGARGTAVTGPRRGALAGGAASAGALAAVEIDCNGCVDTAAPCVAAGVDACAERRQRATSLQSGGTRAAVLGINDGLVTSISLLLGVVGATATPQVVQLAGLASLVAGAASMAVGE